MLTEVKDSAATDVIKRYTQSCEDAYKDFCQHHWRYSYTDKKTGRRCENVASKHLKGHQLENGKIVAVGNYVRTDDIDPDTNLPALIRAILSEYKRLSQRCNGDKSVGISEAVKLHREILGHHLYLKIWNGSKVPGSSSPVATASHSTCLSCLFSTPGIVGPCGHVLCDACVEDFSEHDGDFRTVRCPLCGITSSGKSNERDTWTLKTDPLWVAPRVLSLDGYVARAASVLIQHYSSFITRGGVRSIIQLKILSLLETDIDLGLPIQEFFDLIIGTRYNNTYQRWTSC